MRFFALLIVITAPFFWASAQNKEQAKIDSLEKVFATTKSDVTKARSLCRLCEQILKTGRDEAALEKCEAGRKLARKIGDREAEENCLNRAAQIYYSTGKYARALDYYRKSLEASDENGDRSGEANSMGNIGNVYYNQGDYARALDYYQKSLKIKDEIGDRIGVSKLLNNIGSIYYIQRDYARALDYFRKSLKILEEIDDRSGEANSLGNIGNIYYNQGDYARALDHFQRSLKLQEEIGDKFGVSSLLNNIGGIYYIQRDYDRALDYYQKSLKIKNEIGDRSGEAYTLASIASVKNETKQPAKGSRIAARALKLATEIRALNQMKLAALLHAQADSALGDWKSAYEYHKLFKQYSDSLKNDAKSQEIGRLEAKYDFDKEIKKREREERAAAERREIYIWAAAAAFAALLLVAGLLAWGYRTKRNANKQLALQNKEIRRQRAELDTALAELRELSQFKESMTGMIVHDLKNPLSVVLGRAELTGDAPLKAAALQMNGLTMNMLDVQKFETADANLELAPVSTKQLAAAALEQVAFLAEQKQIALLNDADANRYINADESYMVRVLVNLLNNAVKFTPYGGTIRVSATETEDGNVELSVTDSGAGIPEDKLEAVFDKFSKLEDKDGLNKKGTGLGLTFCKLAAEAHGGTIRAENAPQGGARFRLTLPRAESPEGAAALASTEMATAAMRAELSAEDKAALRPVVAQLRTHEIYETSVIFDALNLLIEAPATEALDAWRRRAENAIFAMDEAALARIMDEAEA